MDPAYKGWIWSVPSGPLYRVSSTFIRLDSRQLNITQDIFGLGLYSHWFEWVKLFLLHNNSNQRENRQPPEFFGLLTSLLWLALGIPYATNLKIFVSSEKNIEFWTHYVLSLDCIPNTNRFIKKNFNQNYKQESLSFFTLFSAPLFWLPFTLHAK